MRPAGDEAKIADLAPPGYSVLSFRCSAGGSGAKGGGKAFVIRDSLESRKHARTQFHTPTHALDTSAWVKLCRRPSGYSDVIVR